MKKNLFFLLLFVFFVSNLYSFRPNGRALARCWPALRSPCFVPQAMDPVKDRCAASTKNKQFLEKLAFEPSGRLLSVNQPRPVHPMHKDLINALAVTHKNIKIVIGSNYYDENFQDFFKDYLSFFQHPEIQKRGIDVRIAFDDLGVEGDECVHKFIVIDGLICMTNNHYLREDLQGLSGSSLFVDQELATKLNQEFKSITSQN